MTSAINIQIINQLYDNYSYIISSKKNKKALVVDPAESKPIIDFIKKKNLSLEALLITHNHADHTSGIKDLINFQKVDVYSPNFKINETTKIIRDKETINFQFIEFEVIATPGHTIDHVVYYSKKNNILFSGDTLFSLGCGRVFEGTYEQMFMSLQTINDLPDQTSVYCGHEYTHQNYKFLNSIFLNYKALDNYKIKIDERLKTEKRTIPFSLANEKIINPFLCSKVIAYDKFMQINNLSGLSFFTHIRNLKNNF